MKFEINREYKDSVFTLYFNDKERLIEVYNAIKGTNYTSDVNFEINTLQDALYLGKYNDISFILDNKFVVLIEHQATINQNMPLRFLLYVAKIYEKLIDEDSIYREKLLKIPTPEFIVLYNGTKKFPNMKKLKLSASYFDKVNSANQLELTATVYNINSGYNEKILNRSKSLNGYSLFVGKVRENQKNGMDDKEAMKEAVKYCIDKNIMYDFIKKHGSEVMNMLFTEFNIDRAKKVWQEEAREDGERRAEKRIEKRMARKLLQRGMTIEQIAEISELSVKEIQKLQKQKKG